MTPRHAWLAAALVLAASATVGQVRAPSAPVLTTPRLALPAAQVPVSKARLAFDRLQAERAAAARKAMLANRPPLPPKPGLVEYNRGDDCDDSRRTVNRRVPEVCNGYDDNCDGAIDEGVTTTFFLDADGDRHGDRSRRVDACPQHRDEFASAGIVLETRGDDCDDTDPDRWSGCP